MRKYQTNYSNLLKISMSTRFWLFISCRCFDFSYGRVECVFAVVSPCFFLNFSFVSVTVDGDAMINVCYVSMSMSDGILRFLVVAPRAEVKARTIFTPEVRSPPKSSGQCRSLAESTTGSCRERKKKISHIPLTGRWRCIWPKSVRCEWYSMNCGSKLYMHTINFH